MVKYSKQKTEFLKKSQKDMPVPIRHYNLEPGTRLDVSSLRGLLSFETNQLKSTARRKIEYVEVVKEYDTYILVRAHTSVPIKTIHNVGAQQYYTYTEAISKYALTINDNAYIKVLE